MLLKQTCIDGWNFDNTYATLPATFFRAVTPEKPNRPELVIYNQLLGKQLGLQYSVTTHPEIANIFSGNELPAGAFPVAQAYAGHQFGYFNMLGDGRAVLLGEQLAPDAKRWDIQLKGSGQTPYSRRGDGKATLSAMLREYLMSEAMHGLGVPTTRSLAVVKTGSKVFRETAHEGAVLARVAASHIRVGTFEYAKNFLNNEDLKKLLHYSIERHAPELRRNDKPALALLEEVIHQQVKLIVHWMRTGFIHGVMNTDNMSIAGETIDYGPCAFMNAYYPETVFSSIDTQGRYAYGNQPAIAHWNLTCFADTLLPLLSDETGEAIEMVKPLLQQAATLFEKEMDTMMAAKIGFEKPVADDKKMVSSALLKWMIHNKADYTNTFRYIMGDHVPGSDIYLNSTFIDWHKHWMKRIAETDGGMEKAMALMSAHNPIYIPRNHLVEEALTNVAQNNDYGLFHELLNLCSNPYRHQPQKRKYQQPPLTGDAGYQTFCNT
jgi:uncharacterized protein YdiU (UPF0061 family)